jgi:hypothetical protein
VTPEARRMRGVAAQALLNDETISNGWTDIENDLRAQWEACWLPRKRDRLWAELRTLKALRAKLASYASHAPRD